MKILIIDDKTEFLNVARSVAVEFPEVHFDFTTSAAEALKKLEEYDGIITDMFFPREEDSALNFAYRQYMSLTADSPAFFEVIDIFYRKFGGIEKAEQKLKDCLELMQTGTIRDILELSAPEFPYGGAIMLKAKALGKKCILVTNLHRHATSFTDAATSVDGFMLLLPLIEKKIVTAEEVSSGRADGYMSNARKEESRYYRIAISRLLL